MANIAKAGLLLAFRSGHACQAGNLGNDASFSFILAQCRRGAGKFKSRKFTMHLPARAYAFHDLLPDVTALGEVQGASLPSLLGQVAVADILAVVGDAAQYTPYLQR